MAMDNYVKNHFYPFLLDSKPVNSPFEWVFKMVLG